MSSHRHRRDAPFFADMRWAISMDAGVQSIPVTSKPLKAIAVVTEPHVGGTEPATDRDVIGPIRRDLSEVATHDRGILTQPRLLDGRSVGARG